MSQNIMTKIVEKKKVASGDFQKNSNSMQSF